MCGNLHPMGKALCHITKNKFLIEIAWSVNSCMKLVFSKSPHHHKWLGGLGSNAQNSAMSSTKISVKCAQSFHIGRLPNMFFFSMQIWTFLSIPSKTNFYEYWWPPIPMPWVLGASEHDFLCRFGYFIQVLGKMMGGSWWTWVFYTDFGSFVQFLGKLILGETTLLPHHYSNEGLEVGKHDISMQIQIFYSSHSNIL